MSKPDDIPQDVWDAASAITHHDAAHPFVEPIARAIMAAKAEEREACAVDGWNACRRSIYAVCEDVDTEYEKHRQDTGSVNRHHFGRGGITAAKSIARGFGAMEALDDDNLTAAIRKRGEA